jgi:hypothetical protein
LAVIDLATVDPVTTYLATADLVTVDPAVDVVLAADEALKRRSSAGWLASVGTRAMQKSAGRLSPRPFKATASTYVLLASLTVVLRGRVGER